MVNQPIAFENCVPQAGSKKLLTEPKAPGSLYKTLDQDGYDDGGVGDLSLVMDLEDNIVRRKRGDADYQAAYRADLLPRIKKGNYAQLQRRDQKIQLAQMLFGDGETEQDSDTKASEVYMDNEREVDENTKKQRLERLNIAKQCLEISYILREVACQSLSLSEISKRHLALKGKDGAEDALRCATKAAEIASNGFYDNDEIFMEVSARIATSHKKVFIIYFRFRPRKTQRLIRKWRRMLPFMVLDIPKSYNTNPNEFPCSASGQRICTWATLSPLLDGTKKPVKFMPKSYRC